MEINRDIERKPRESRSDREGKKKEKRRRACAYPGVPVLSWGSAWLPLLCCSLLQRHDCIPLFTHYPRTQTHLAPLAAASPCYTSSSPSILLWFHTDTYTHSHLNTHIQALKHALSSSSSLSVSLIPSLCPTALICRCSLTPNPLPFFSLPIRYSAFCRTLAVSVSHLL